MKTLPEVRLGNPTPCKKCGSLETHKNGRCRKCRNAASAAFYKANQEKCRKAASDRRKKNPVAGRMAASRWAQANPEKVKAKMVEWRAKNKEHTRAYRKANKTRDRIVASEWNKANKERVKETKTRWQKENAERHRIYAHTRRALKKSNGGKISVGLSAKLLKLQKGKCACCNMTLEKYHLDHIMPIVLGGANTDENIQLLCPTCNHQKHAKHPVDFMQEKGFLL